MSLNVGRLSPLQVEALELRHTAIEATTTRVGRLWLQRYFWRPYLLTPYMPKYIPVPSDNEDTNSLQSYFALCRLTAAPAPGLSIIAHHKNGSIIPFEQISFNLGVRNNPIVNFQTIGSLDDRPVVLGNMNPYGEEASLMVGALSAALSLRSP